LYKLQMRKGHYRSLNPFNHSNQQYSTVSYITVVLLQCFAVTHIPADIAIGVVHK
jgi:hypothetical protein